jgi:uncharacterized protein YkwD
VPGSGVSWSYGSFPFNPLLFGGDLLNQINMYRAERQLRALQWHDGIGLVAQKHSIDMNTRKYLALVSPEGIDLCERLVSSTPRIDFDTTYHFVAIAGTSTDMFSKLLSNPSGKEAIEDDSVTHFGASFQVSTPGASYVTVIFAVNARP